VSNDNQLANTNIASLDPGVRTFNTIYDTLRDSCIFFGSGDISTINHLSHIIDNLKSKMTTVKARQRRNIKTVIKRVRKKIDNLLKEAHCKLAKFLCDHYDIVIISKFEVSNMVKKRNMRNQRRNIGRKTVREMLQWCHYKFRQRLLNKAEVCGVTVHEVDEAYTSKTCGRCGKLHKKLGAAKHFICPYCSYAADRDENAARNILLRNLPLISTLL